MLPSVMRADYQKYIYLTDELSEELQDQLFYGLEEISWDQAQERGLLPQLMALRKQQKSIFATKLRREIKSKWSASFKPLRI